MGWRRSCGLGFVIFFSSFWENKKQQKKTTKEPNPWDGEDLRSWGVSFCVFVCFLEVFATFGGNCSKKKRENKKTNMGWRRSGWLVGFSGIFQFFLLLVENLENPFRKHNKMLRNLNCSLVFLSKSSWKNYSNTSILLAVSLVAALFASLWTFVFHVCGQLLFCGSTSDPPLTL